MRYIHYSVLQNEVLEYLLPLRENALFVDCTLGEGGHSSLFLKKYPALRGIGLDRDEKIIEKAKVRLAEYENRFSIRNTWFNDFWTSYEGEKVDFVLFDLGISMFHYEESERGFSFNKSEKLDMRLDVNGNLTAYSIVNYYDEKVLADIIYDFGEERYSRRIASAICKARAENPIVKTDELAEIIFHAVPREYRYRHIHPATKTFQALRIEVNKELTRIETALEGASRALLPRGRIGVITFHSLEDRIVKWFFKNRTNEFEILTKKPIVPTDEECAVNNASRSAKLRVAEKKVV